MLFEATQVGKREQLADYISRVDAKSKPVLAMIPKGPAITNMLAQWQVDNFEDPEDLATVDGKDAETFDNAVPDRAILKTYAQKVRDTAMVSDMAENVSDVAGLPKGELAEAIMKKLEKLGRSMEAAICGDHEMQEGNGSIPYKTRGLGVWIAATGSQSVFPVPAAYDTPATSLNNTAIASVTEDTINDVIQSSYEQTGQENKFQLVCGPTLKRKFSNFTRVSSGATSVYSTVRVYNSNVKDRTIDNVIDKFKGDFGEVELLSSLWNAHANFGGSAAANLRRGYLLLMNMLELRYKRMPRVKQLEDKGGGPRFLVDAIFALIVKNPLALGKFYATT